MSHLTGKVVLVTGAGGSIGSELCRQIVAQDPIKVIAFDNSELALYNLKRELAVVPVLGDVTRPDDLRRAFSSEIPDVVFHAAAYKHVTLCEQNQFVAQLVNLEGTAHVINAVRAFDVDKLILISTDKAVRPTCWMGKTKRWAENIVLATGHTVARLGNVWGSSGSVVPLFQEQIAHGESVTVTHEEATRYFIGVEEAAEFIIRVSALPSGHVYVPDMGPPVRIAQLAVQLGARHIVYTGLQPGEKLHEELTNGSMHEVAPGIFRDDPVISC